VTQRRIGRCCGGGSGRGSGRQADAIDDRRVVASVTSPPAPWHRGTARPALALRHEPGTNITPPG